MSLCKPCGLPRHNLICLSRYTRTFTSTFSWGCFFFPPDAFQTFIGARILWHFLLFLYIVNKDFIDLSTTVYLITRSPITSLSHIWILFFLPQYSHSVLYYYPKASIAFRLLNLFLYPILFPCFNEGNNDQVAFFIKKSQP